MKVRQSVFEKIQENLIYILQPSHNICICLYISIERNSRKLSNDNRSYSSLDNTGIKFDLNTLYN